MGCVVITHEVVDIAPHWFSNGRYGIRVQCIGRFVVHLYAMRLIDTSKLFGETYYVWDSQHLALEPPGALAFVACGYLSQSHSLTGHLFVIKPCRIRS